MNERIQELVRQATTKEAYYPAGNDGHPEYRIDFNKEKFAELIVRECADICYNRDYTNGSAYGEAIEEHFGVEE